MQCAAVKIYVCGSRSRRTTSTNNPRKKIDQKKFKGIAMSLSKVLIL